MKTPEEREDDRRRAVLFNDITHAPREDDTYWWLSDRQQLADYLWAQGWRRDVRPEDETPTRPTTKEIPHA